MLVRVNCVTFSCTSYDPSVHIIHPRQNSAQTVALQHATPPYNNTTPTMSYYQNQNSILPHAINGAGSSTGMGIGMGSKSQGLDPNSGRSKRGEDASELDEHLSAKVRDGGGMLWRYCVGDQFETV